MYCPLDKLSDGYSGMKLSRRTEKAAGWMDETARSGIEDSRYFEAIVQVACHGATTARQCTVTFSRLEQSICCFEGNAGPTPKYPPCLLLFLPKFCLLFHPFPVDDVMDECSLVWWPTHEECVCYNGWQYVLTLLKLETLHLSGVYGNGHQIDMCCNEGGF